MSIPDDEDFQSYLKQFRPINPEALNLVKRRAKWHLPAFAGWAAAVAIFLILMMAMIWPYYRLPQSSDATLNLLKIQQYRHVEPLTIRSANALLSQAPSFKEAIDQIVVQTGTFQFAIGTQSALEALSKEDTQL